LHIMCHHHVGHPENVWLPKTTSTVDQNQASPDHRCGALLHSPLSSLPKPPRRPTPPPNLARLKTSSYRDHEPPLLALVLAHVRADATTVRTTGRSLTDLFVSLYLYAPPHDRIRPASDFSRGKSHCTRSCPLMCADAVAVRVKTSIETPPRRASSIRSEIPPPDASEPLLVPQSHLLVA